MTGTAASPAPTVPAALDARRPDPAPGADADPLAGVEVMSDAELRMVREYLGLSGESLAALLGVTERTVRRWERGTHPIPESARTGVEALEAAAAGLVETAVTTLENHHDPGEVALSLYRTDADYWAAHPQMRPHPASWHRAITARVAQQVPGLAITYATAEHDHATHDFATGAGQPADAAR